MDPEASQFVEDDFEDGDESFDEDEYDEDEVFTSDEDGSEEDGNSDLDEASHALVSAALKNAVQAEALESQAAAKKPENFVIAPTSAAAAPVVVSEDKGGASELEAKAEVKAPEVKAEEKAPEDKVEVKAPEVKVEAKAPEVKPQADVKGIPGMGPLLPPKPAVPKAAPAKPAEVVDPNAWKGLQTFPSTTIAGVQAQIAKLQQQGKKDLTIMLLGKNGVGKSSTANSLFGEKVFNVSAFQSNTAQPAVASKSAAGFTIRIIDTPGLLDGDTVNEGSLDTIFEFLDQMKQPVDVFVYVDRLDGYRVTNIDSHILEALTNLFGPEIWSHSLFVLTHGQVAPPEGYTYTQFITKRGEQLQAAARDCGAGTTVPVAVVENSSRCTTNTSSEKVLPNETVWISNLVTHLVDVSSRNKAGLLPETQDADVYAKKNRWAIIPMLLFNIFVVRPLVSRKIKLDIDFN